MRPITLTAATLLALAFALALLFFLSHGYTLFAVLAITFGIAGLVMHVTYSTVPLSETEPYITMIASMYLTVAEQLVPPVRYVCMNDVVYIIDGEGTRRTSPMHYFLKYVEDRYGLALRGRELEDVAVRDIVSSVLVDTLYLCRRVGVLVQQRRITITLEGAHPEYVKFIRYYSSLVRTLGSPMTMLIATLIAYAYSTAVIPVEEEIKHNTIRISIELA